MFTENGAEILFGNADCSFKPFSVFDDKVCSFLDLLSKELRTNRDTRAYSDIHTFAFFIRKANLDRLKQRTNIGSSEFYRFGRGLVFHITPSNIPINFAYSWVFGLLSGNSNIVKVSSKRFEQTKIICEASEKVIKQNPELLFIKDTNQIVLYERNRDDITGAFLSKCDAKVIWGGDSTIKKVRGFECKPRSIEVAFADRYSFAVFNSDAILNANEEEIVEICHRFYNDTFLVDQNACSSPHMIFWLGNSSESAKDIFFSRLKEISKKYQLSEIVVSDKFEHLCRMAAEKKIDSVNRYSNVLYAYDLNDPNSDIEKYRGKCGEFFNIHVNKIDEMIQYFDDEKIQTCVVYGVNKNEILSSILQRNIKGIDRIVDVGQALSLDIFWDGCNVLETLSRVIMY